MPGMADMINPQGAAPVGFQAAGQFQQALTPQQAPQEGPPTTPQELEQRKSGWQEFITKLQTDPAMRQAAILTATQMMRGPAQGESFAGGLGRALQVGTLAHGFLQGNQNQQAIEQTKLAEQQKMNTSAIEQNTVQTDGLRQQQEFAAQAQPGALTMQQQQIGAGDFTAANRDLMLQDTLLNSAANRKSLADRGQYFRNRGVAVGGPKTPAGVALFERQKEELKMANPMGPDEDPLDYEARISQLTLDYTGKNRGGNSQGVQVQALQKLLDTLETDDPLYAQTQRRLNEIGQGTPQAGGGGGAAPTGGKGFPTAAFDRANDIAKKAGKSTFIGPDGGTYRVK